MARVHVLSSPRAGRYDVVLHTLVPAGNNHAGVPWKTVLLAVMPQGTLRAASAGEQAAATAGDLVEIAATIDIEPSAMSGPTVVSRVEEFAAGRIAAWIAETERAYRYWGYSQGVVS